MFVGLEVWPVLTGKEVLELAEIEEEDLNVVPASETHFTVLFNDDVSRQVPMTTDLSLILTLTFACRHGTSLHPCLTRL